MEWTKELSVCDPPTLFGTNIVDEQKKCFKMEKFYVAKCNIIVFPRKFTKKNLGDGYSTNIVKQ